MCFHGLIESELATVRDSIKAFSERATVIRIFSANKDAEIRGGKETFLVAHAFNSLFDFRCAHRRLCYLGYKVNTIQCGCCDFEVQLIPDFIQISALRCFRFAFSDDVHKMFSVF